MASSDRLTEIKKRNIPRYLYNRDNQQNVSIYKGFAA